MYSNTIILYGRKVWRRFSRLASLFSAYSVLAQALQPLQCWRGVSRADSFSGQRCQLVCVLTVTCCLAVFIRCRKHSSVDVGGVPSRGLCVFSLLPQQAAGREVLYPNKESINNPNKQTLVWKQKCLCWVHSIDLQILGESWARWQIYVEQAAHLHLNEIAVTTYWVSGSPRALSYFNAENNCQRLDLLGSPCDRQGHRFRDFK